METWKIILLIIGSICLFLGILGQYFINQRHSKELKELQELKEFLKISMDDHWLFLIKQLLDEQENLKNEQEDHWLLIKDLRDKVGVNKKRWPQGPDGPEIEHSPNLWNEVKRVEKK